MKSHATRLLALLFSLLPFSVLSAYADSIDLGTAGSYAVLAGSTVTNTGSSVLFGNLGVSPGTAVTGFPPGIVHGTINAANAAAAQAQLDLTTAYNQAAGLKSTGALAGSSFSPSCCCIASFNAGGAFGSSDCLITAPAERNCAN